MSPVVAVLLVLVVASVFTVLTRKPTPDSRRSEQTEAAWQKAFSENDSLFGAGMLRMARPLSSSPYVARQAGHPAWNTLREKVTSSGLYGGSLDVFLSYQLASILIGACMCLAALATTGPMRIGLALLGSGLALMPYNKISTSIKKRSELVNGTLPEFVELLQMPLGSGLSVVHSMRFTTRFVQGPVAVEVKWLLDSLAQASRPEEEYFREAGLRLGTPEAVAFFSALGQAHIEGVRVSETLARQAEGLRVVAFQQRRAKVKQIPVKLIVTFALHFLPMLFIMTMIPLMYSMANM